MRPRTLGKWAATLSAVFLTVAMMEVTLTLTSAQASERSAVRARLLTVANMPAGWRAATASGGGSNAVTLGSCLAMDRKLPKGGSKATATFSGPEGFPAFEEELASGKKGQTLFRSIERGLSKCKSLYARTGSRTITAKVTRLRFPRLGKASDAFSLAAAITRVKIDISMALFRTGRFVGLTSFVTLGSPRAATERTFVALTKKAVKRAG